MVVTGLAADLYALQERSAKEYDIKLVIHHRDIAQVYKAAEMSIPGRKGKVKVSGVGHGAVRISGNVESVRRFVNDMRRAGVRYKVASESLENELAPLMEVMVSAPDQLMLAIGPLRSFTRALDRMMVAGNDLVETAERAGYDRIEIANSIRGWNRQLGGVYGDFAKARVFMYNAAKAASIPTKRFSKKHPKKKLSGMPLLALTNDVDRVARNLSGGIKKTGNQAAFLLRNLDRLDKKWSKKTPDTNNEAFRGDAAAVINEFLTLRDMVGGSIFASMNGIVRRLDAMSVLQGGDRFGNPPRPVKVPSPAEVDRLQPRGRDIPKKVPTERAPKPKEMPKPKAAKGGMYPSGFSPGSSSSKKMPTVMIGGKEVLLTRRMISKQMTPEQRLSHAAWAKTPAALEAEMGQRIPGTDTMFEEILSMEHRRAAGEYALNDGQTARPTPSDVHFLKEMGALEEAYVAHVFRKGKEIYVDSAFVNQSQHVMSDFSLSHMGFGEFELKGPDGVSIQFDRMRGRKFPGQSGRSHLLYGSGKGADKYIKKLVGLMLNSGKAVEVTKKMKRGLRGESTEGLTEAYVGTVYRDGKNTYIDTAFINNVSGMLPGFEVHHLGFGEFELKGPGNESVQFDRMRGKDFPGQSGRSHLIYMHSGGDKKIISKLVASMVKKGKAKIVKATKVPGPKDVAKSTGMRVAGKPRGKLQKAILDMLEVGFQGTKGMNLPITPKRLKQYVQTKGYSESQLKKALEAMVKSGIIDKQIHSGGYDYKLAEDVEVVTESKYKLKKILKTYKVQDPKREAKKLGGVIGADKGIGAEVIKHKGGWLMLADDGRGILFLKEGVEEGIEHLDEGSVEFYRAKFGLRPSTKEEAIELRTAVRKIAKSLGMNPREVSVQWINKKTVDISPPHPLGAKRAFYEKVTSYLNKNGWGEIGETDGKVHMVNWPKEATGIVAKIGNLMKRAGSKSESLGEAKVTAKVTNVKLDHPDGVRYLVKVDGYGMVEVIKHSHGMLSVKGLGKPSATATEVAVRAVKKFMKAHPVAKKGTRKGGAHWEDVGARVDASVAEG